MLYEVITLHMRIDAHEAGNLGRDHMACKGVRAGNAQQADRFMFQAAGFGFCLVMLCEYSYNFV